MVSRPRSNLGEVDGANCVGAGYRSSLVVAVVMCLREAKQGSDWEMTACDVLLASSKTLGIEHSWGRGELMVRGRVGEWGTLRPKANRGKLMAVEAECDKLMVVEVKRRSSAVS